MKVHTLEFNCCCDVRFKKIYSRYIRSLRVQYGKKKFKEASISYSEYIDKDKSITLYNSCRKCYTLRKKNDVTITKINVKVEI